MLWKRPPTTHGKVGTLGKPTRADFRFSCQSPVDTGLTGASSATHPGCNSGAMEVMLGKAPGAEVTSAGVFIVFQLNSREDASY